MVSKIEKTLEQWQADYAAEVEWNWMVNRTQLRRAKPEAVLERLTRDSLEEGRKEQAVRRDGETDLWIALAKSAQRDLHTLCYSRSGYLAEEIFKLPGFISAASNDENVVRHYLYCLFDCMGWWKHPKHYDTLAQVLIGMFRRRSRIPMRWSTSNLDEGRPEAELPAPHRRP